MNRQPRLVIDSSCLCYRAKLSLADMSYEDQETGVIFGFLIQLRSLANMFKTNDFVFAWDSRKSIRRDMYHWYKSKRRDKTPEEKEIDEIALPQFGLLRTQVLPGIGFNNNFIQTGLEADDIIAAVVMSGQSDGGNVVVSTDNDLLQLLDFCDIFNPQTKKTITSEDFTDKWGIEPMQWSLVKAMAGCTSDSVPGISGIGEKSAVAFLRDELKKTSKKYESIVSEDGRAITERNEAIVTLPFADTETPEVIENDFDLDYFSMICGKYGFGSFLKQDAYLGWCKIFEGDFDGRKR